jgi:1-acylglycerone phosphate reductase
MTEVLSLECRPFDVKVMLVAPASIKSEIINKSDNYTLPAHSIYTSFLHNIRDRLEAARTPDAMSTEGFAEEIIAKATSANPPAYVLTGGKAYMFRIMAYLPRWVVLNIVWNMYSKPKTK